MIQTTPNNEHRSLQAVEVSNLVKKFGSFVAVNSISFTVRRGEIFGFLGPNGAGKSTTIRMLCGLIRPTSGKGIVDGYDMATESLSIRQNIGYMSQKFSLYDDLTVLENISFFGGIYRVNPSKFRERISFVLELSGLKHHKNELTGQLAAGFKQRLALGCAVLHEPRILFLDEPTSGVDPSTRRNFWDFIYLIAEQGVTVFVTTHYMDEAEYCHRLALIQGGKVIATGTPNELKERHGGKDMWVFSCENPQKAFDLLKRQLVLEKTALFGSKVRALYRGNAADLEELIRTLNLQGAEILDVQPHRPNLEDVFIHLVTGQGESQT